MTFPGQCLSAKRLIPYSFFFAALVLPGHPLCLLRPAALHQGGRAWALQRAEEPSLPAECQAPGG